ncbi:hypothetical protein BT63DRAFT_411860 [Microthyrium microscopicum]|uniref:Uncharacterized protein n=1 Tax=Microthyrium microscopicum TaxID=703497 RepID=A0A6A6UI37_9PEZI|nr:hypothetical protein BT63DRAFT_411860 [Microthyrium microscopicum]
MDERKRHRGLRHRLGLRKEPRDNPPQPDAPAPAQQPHQEPPPIADPATTSAVNAVTDPVPDLVAVAEAPPVGNSNQDPPPAVKPPEPPVAEVSLRLWTGAYHAVKDSEPSLVEDYEMILTRYKNGPSKENAFANVDDEERLKLMKEITDKSLRKAKSRPKAEAAVEGTVQAIEFARELVGGFLEPYPPAALAWSGFCTITPFLLKPILETKKLRDGLEEVVGNMRFSMNLAPLLLRESWKNDVQFQSLQTEMSSCIQKYYQGMLIFEMNCVKACHNRWNFIKDWVSANNWDGQVSDIRKAKEELESKISLYSNEAIKEHLRTTITTLQGMQSDLGEMRKNQEKSMLRELTKDRDIMVGEFNITQYVPADAEELNKRRIPGTCEWFLTDDKYLEWLNSNDSKLLLVSAPPGCGKSVLSAYLIQEEFRRQWPDEQICYYFFKDQVEQNKITNALRVLLHQLFLGSPDVIEYVESEIRRAGKALKDDFKKLGGIFQQAVKTGLTAHVICVLDALDECDPGKLQNLIDWIDRLISATNVKSKSSITVKFLLTTRGLPVILNAFSKCHQTLRHVSAEEKEDSLQNEIELVMEAQFEQFARNNGLDKEPEKRKDLWDNLTRLGQHQRTYLWVELIFKALGETRLKMKSEWEALIKDPPLTIFATYGRLLKFVKPNEQSRVKVLMHLVFAAQRPLSLVEASMAMTVHTSKKDSAATVGEYVDDLMKERAFREWLLPTCGFFISVYGDRLFFIHQTAKDYLSTPMSEGELADPKIEPQLFRGTVTDRLAHAVAAEACIAFLSIKEVLDLEEDDLGNFFPLQPHDHDNFDSYLLSTLEQNEASRANIETLPRSTPVQSYDSDFIAAPSLDLLGSSSSNSHLSEKASPTQRFYVDLYYFWQFWALHFEYAQELPTEKSQSVIDVEDRFMERYYSLWILPLPISVRNPLAWSGYPTVPETWHHLILLSVILGQAKLVERVIQTTESTAILHEDFTFTRYNATYFGQLWHAAYEWNHKPLVKWLLNHGSEAKQPLLINDTSMSVLERCITKCDRATAKLLIKRGEDIDELNGNGLTHLTQTLKSIVCSGIDEPDDFTLRRVELLLRMGASWKSAMKYIGENTEPSSDKSERALAVQLLDHPSLRAYKAKCISSMREQDGEPAKSLEQHGRLNRPLNGRNVGNYSPSIAIVLILLAYSFWYLASQSVLGTVPPMG